MSDSLRERSRIRIAAINSQALPLFSLSAPDGSDRTGYETQAAQLVFAELGYDIEWVFLPWEEMLPAVRSGDCDVVWCGQGVTPERAALVDFTAPYAIFNETLVLRAGDTASSPDELSGYRIGAIENSTNMKLAATFPGVELVGFGSSDDVFGDMIEATRDGTIDGFVDDDVVMVPLAESDPDFVAAFTVATANRWAVGVKPGNDELREQINSVLEQTIADGRLAALWDHWMPLLPFPLEAAVRQPQ